MPQQPPRETEKMLAVLLRRYVIKGDKMKTIAELVKQEIDKTLPVTLWDMSATDLEKEMWNILASMESGVNCLPAGPVTSQRKVLKGPLVLAKKTMRFLTAPYSRLLLDKQNLLNQEMLQFQLAAFLRLRLLEQRVRDLEQKIYDLTAAAPTTP